MYLFKFLLLNLHWKLTLSRAHNLSSWKKVKSADALNMITPTGEERKTTVRRIACCAYLKSSSTSAMPAANCHMPHGAWRRVYAWSWRWPLSDTWRRLLEPWHRLIELTFNLELHLGGRHSVLQLQVGVQVRTARAQWAHRRGAWIEAITIQLRDIYKLIKFVCCVAFVICKTRDVRIYVNFRKMLFFILLGALRPSQRHTGCVVFLWNIIIFDIFCFANYSGICLITLRNY